MAHQVHSYAMRIATKVSVYQLLALGLALAAAILGMPGGGGGGGVG
jgi:hypothetical protein